MPSPIPRCSSAVLLSLASHRDGGLRLFRTSSAFTLPFSRLARRSLMLWPARSLIAFSATFCTEGFARSSCPLRTLRLLPAGATVAGWDIFLPLEWRALFTAHAKVGLTATNCVRTVRWPRRLQAFRQGRSGAGHSAILDRIHNHFMPIRLSGLRAYYPSRRCVSDARMGPPLRSGMIFSCTIRTPSITTL